ncbi:MAG: M28 family peptidase, partial [Bacteroidota bacterium]|nr:M28 family peptidase [Bacteroidota bacterium]
YIATHSHCAELESANAVATFPGPSGRKIVIGAHFDSWDVSQGAIDNGLGTAVLFEVARLVHRFVPDRKHTIECVWFNGEELGLWGAKKYVEKHASDDIAVVINMDMIGTPTGFNAMGNDTLLPFLRALARDLNGFGMSTEIGNQPWTNSDHMPFIMNGIPTITLYARLDEAMGRTYHDFPDTFDKVSKRYLSDAAAVVGVLAAELSRSENLGLRRRTREQTVSFLRKFRLEDILRREGEWIFE